MPLNFLMWHALKTGETHHSEEGKGVTIASRAGETILLYHIDRPEFYKYFNIRNACDVLFFYRRGDSVPLLFFVELKGSDLHHAVEQLKQPLKAMKGRLQSYQATYKALVVMSGSAPLGSELQKLQKSFKAETGAILYVKSGSKGRNADLRNYIDD